MEGKSTKPVVSIGSELVGSFGETRLVQKKRVTKQSFLKPIATFQRYDTICYV